MDAHYTAYRQLNYYYIQQTDFRNIFSCSASFFDIQQHSYCVRFIHYIREVVFAFKASTIIAICGLTMKI